MSEYQERVLEIARMSGALHEGHFVLASGRHSAAYVNKRAMYVDPSHLAAICRCFAEIFAELAIEAVFGPPEGAIPLSRETARQLSLATGKHVPAILARKVPSLADASVGMSDSFAFLEGSEAMVRGRRTIVVEDITTTAGSARRGADLIKNAGGYLIGVGIVCDRSGMSLAQLGEALDAVPHVLSRIQLETYPADDCPLCKRSVPIRTDLGKGAEYLRRKQGAA